MSTPFKMKGWSGNQSPIRQNPKVNLKASLANIQKSISNTLKGVGTNIRKHVKPQSSSSGLGLTSLEKAQAKKLGLSEYQWKTGVGVSGTTRHKKRMWEKKNKLGKYASEEIVDDFGGQYGDDGSKSVEDIVSTVESDPDVNIIKGQPTSTPTEVDYGTGFDWKDWGQKSSTGWNLHDLVKERNNLNPNSPEYRVVQDIINETKRKTGGRVEKEEVDIVGPGG